MLEIAKPGSTVYLVNKGAVTKEVVEKVKCEHTKNGSTIRYKLEGHRNWFFWNDFYPDPVLAFESLQPSTDDSPAG